MANLDKQDFRKRFIRELIALRLWNCQTQKEFAEDLNMSARTMSDLEMGKIGLNEQILVGLGHKCGYYLLYMLGMAAFPEQVQRLIEELEHNPLTKRLLKKVVAALQELGPTGEEKYYFTDKMRVTKRMQELKRQREEQKLEKQQKKQKQQKPQKTKGQALKSK